MNKNIRRFSIFALALVFIIVLFFRNNSKAYSEVVLSSYDDIKNNAEVTEVNGIKYSEKSKKIKILSLKKGDYKLGNDISISEQQLRKDYPDVVFDYGLISLLNSNFDGNGKTITLSDKKSHPLFLYVNTKIEKTSEENEEKQITNFKLKTNDVYLAPFAFSIEAISTGYLQSLTWVPLNISNISVEVGGNVIPQESNSGTYIVGGTPTVSASGFAQDIEGANIENIDLVVNGDVGSYTEDDPMPTDKNSYWFMSCGFARGIKRLGEIERISLKNIDLNNLSEGVKEIKKSGSLENTNVKIKGNIVSEGNVATFASGFAKGSSTYVNNLNLEIDGNIENIQNGGTSIARIVPSFTTLVANDVVAFTNSNITLNGDIKVEEKGQIINPNAHLTKIYLGSEGNSFGYYTLLYNNKLKVKGNIEAKNNSCAGAFFGGSFTALWGNIVNQFDTIIQKNTTEVVGDINYGSSAYLEFSGIFDRIRQPVKSDSITNVNGDETYFSVKNNGAKYNNINLHGGNYIVGGLIAKGLDIKKSNHRIADIIDVQNYQDISIKANNIDLSVDKGSIDFSCGVSDLCTSMKDIDIEVGDINATGNNLNYFSISGATGYLHRAGLTGDEQKSKLYKDYVPTIENVNIKMGNISAKLGYAEVAKSYLAGIVAYSGLNTVVKNSSVSTGNINVENTNISDVKENEFYLGGAFGKVRSEVNNVVASTKSIDVKNALEGYIGGFTGYDVGQVVDNCKSFLDGNLSVEKAKKTVNVGGFNGYKMEGSTKNSDTLVTGSIEVKESNYPNIGGFTGFNYQAEDMNNALQILGNLRSLDYISNSKVGGYIGNVYNVNANNCSSLIFGDIENKVNSGINNSNRDYSSASPFIGFVAYQGGNESNKVSNSATYLGGILKGDNSFNGAFSGVMTSGNLDNFTYLVDKETGSESKDKLFADKFIGGFDNRKVQLGNIYTVTVNDGDREAFSVVYKPDEKKFTKNKDSLGKIKIAPRSFQDEYWGKNLNREKSIGTFEYVKDSGGLNFENYNNTVESVSDNNKNVKIANFINRNLSVQNNGITYDLLGIKSGKVDDNKNPSNNESGGGSGGNTSSGGGNNTGTGGKDRVDTSISISNKYYNTSKIAIICRKDLYPDSLTATVLAKILNSPILLTDTNVLDYRVKEELNRLGTKKIIIVGGNKSVSDNVKKELEKLSGSDVERISGVDRYGTSEMVARKIVYLVGQKNRAVIASGEVFADALSISPFAAINEYPILLVRKEDVPLQIKRAIKDLKILNSYVAGGENTISIKNYKTLPSPFERIGGKNRYETAVLIAKEKFKDAKRAYVTSGEVFADALVIGPVAGKENIPILLVRKNPPLPEVKNYISNSKIEKLDFIGGYRTISNEARNYFNKN